jgi:hypothetical protein
MSNLEEPPHVCRTSIDVEALAPLLGRELGKAGLFSEKASVEFATNQARLMLLDIAREYARLTKSAPKRGVRFGKTERRPAVWLDEPTQPAAPETEQRGIDMPPQSGFYESPEHWVNTVPTAPETERLGEAWHRHRHEVHRYPDVGGCTPLTCLADILARLTKPTLRPGVSHDAAVESGGQTVAPAQPAAPETEPDPYLDAVEHERQSRAGTHLFDPVCAFCAVDAARAAQPTAPETERERRRKYAGAFARPPAAPETEPCPNPALHRWPKGTGPDEPYDPFTNPDGYQPAAPETERLASCARGYHQHDGSQSCEDHAQPAAPETPIADRFRRWADRRFAQPAAPETERLREALTSATFRTHHLAKHIAESPAACDDSWCVYFCAALDAAQPAAPETERDYPVCPCANCNLERGHDASAAPEAPTGTTFLDRLRAGTDEGAAQPAAPETGYVEGMTHGTGGNRLARPAAPETVCTCGPWKIGQPQGHLSGCPRAQPPETERLREAAKYALGAMRGQGWHTSAIPRLVKSEADLRAAIEAGDGS